MVKIKGDLKCKDCGWKEEDPEMFFSCPICSKQRVMHTPPHKIFLCNNENPEGHGRLSGKLGNIHKKLLSNEKGKKETYNKIKQFILKEPLKFWTSTEIINKFNIQATTDGDVIRIILDLLVCEGFLKKVFMKGKKYHIYERNFIGNKCIFLKNISKGKREGIYKCSFNFKEYGKELDAKVIFYGKKEEGDDNKETS